MENIPQPSVLTLDPNDENIILRIPEDRDPKSEQQATSTSKKEKVGRFGFFFWGEDPVVKRKYQRLDFMFTFCHVGYVRLFKSSM